jgi:regulator of RNase E activity RraB
LEDGSDPDALYDIEHHLFAENFETLEKAVVEAFKMGFEVLEAEETEDEDGNRLLCCDATMESVLNAEAIDSQVEKLVNLAEKYDIIYDGWGTFYEGDDAVYDEEGDEDGDDEATV